MAKRAHWKNTQSKLCDMEDSAGGKRLELLAGEFAEQEKLRAEILAIIERLPRKQQDVLLLYYYEGMSSREIALAMRTTRGKVFSHLLHACGMIREQLEDHKGRLPDDTCRFVDAPVLTRVFNLDAKKKFPDEKVQRFIKMCRERIKVHRLVGKSKTAAGKLPAWLSNGTKIVMAAVIGIAIATVGIVYPQNQPRQTSSVYGQEASTARGNNTAGTVTITENEVPLSGMPNISVWALANLILAVSGVVLAAAISVSVLIRGNKKQGRMAWLAVIIVLCIIEVVIFSLTQDMRTLMVFFDYWTILMAVVFASEILCAILFFKRKHAGRG